MDAWLENCFAEVADPAYREFNARILHTVDINRMAGVRTPDLRRIAREAAGRPDIDEWLTQLPHERFEAMQVHAFLLNGIRDYDRCVHLIDAFLPHVDNWATCDQLSPQVLAQRPDESLGHARPWMASTSTYTCRFGIGVLMRHFLGERFVP
jgi:3-methyladenine DNA glycosylase AlkD